MNKQMGILVSTMLAGLGGFACGVQQRSQAPTYGIGAVLSFSAASQTEGNKLAVLEVSMKGVPQKTIDGEMEFFNSRGKSVGVRSESGLKGEECIGTVAAALDTAFAPLVFCDRVIDLSDVRSIVIRDAKGTSHSVTSISVLRSLPSASVTVFAVDFL